MQRKQKEAIARRQDDIQNIAPRSFPPMVTRVSVEVNGKGESVGVIIHPPRFVR